MCAIAGCGRPRCKRLDLACDRVAGASHACRFARPGREQHCPAHYQCNGSNGERKHRRKRFRAQHSADTRKRLIDEARVMAQIDHPNIVRIHDYSERDGHDIGMCSRETH